MVVSNFWHDLGLPRYFDTHISFLSRGSVFFFFLILVFHFSLLYFYSNWLPSCGYVAGP